MLRAQMAEGQEQSRETTKTPVKNIEKAVPQESKKIQEEPKIQKPPTPEVKKANLTEKLNPYFTYDIKKVLTTIGISVIVIIGIALIANYSNWLSFLSQKISNLVNL